MMPLQNHWSTILVTYFELFFFLTQGTTHHILITYWSIRSLFICWFLVFRPIDWDSEHLLHLLCGHGRVKLQLGNGPVPVLIRRGHQLVKRFHDQQFAKFGRIRCPSFSLQNLVHFLLGHLVVSIQIGYLRIF